MEAMVMQMTMCGGRVSTLLTPTGGGCGFRAGYRRLACIDDFDRFLFPAFGSELNAYGSGNNHRPKLRYGIQSSWLSAKVIMMAIYYFKRMFSDYSELLDCPRTARGNGQLWLISEVEPSNECGLHRALTAFCLKGKLGNWPGEKESYWATNFTGMIPSSHCDWIRPLPRGAVFKRRPTLDRLPSLRLRFPFAQDLAPENSLLRSHRLMMQYEATLATPYAYVLLH
ncbi:uncharacterized protein An08g06300 [Aspergillus niger]|uniref:Contig An08c0130, genomic contig n=3 Tax=Aspergillus niger TaxID=5061 RepID=A2QRJ9_ASPNC|nr:uncharacterized protein An08g06300 [Aspergillus niger]CAK45600.1 unnamed protein product [Aspergillus niger]